MKCLDSRRLTGPNLLWRRPGAVLDIEIADTDVDRVVAIWERQAQRLLRALRWRGETTCVRRFRGGASCAISAPPDLLYVATEIAEWAWRATEQILATGKETPVGEVLHDLRREIREDKRPRLHQLINAANKRGVTVVVDAREFSLGLGCYSRCWRLKDLPRTQTVPWSKLGTIPVAMVTGTNGKTTTVRLLGAIGQAAGLCTGISSTDWIAIGGEVVARDDFAGPEGARQVLRDRRTELAILETARGGLLRRGLAIESADAALITNIAADHLGEFGVQDLEELADVKWTVSRALDHNGTLVLNADDPRLVVRASSAECRIAWFSLNPDNPVITAARSRGDTVCTIIGSRIVLSAGREDHNVARIEDIPITLGGAAQHNVANSLGAATLAYALGLPVTAIGTGLCALGVADNPGRANLREIRNFRVLLDFAHNPHGMTAILNLVERLPARRRLLVFGQAGDRSDADIRDLVQAACQTRFDRFMVKRLAKYCRGREPNAVADLICREFDRLGVAPARIEVFDQEIDAVRAATAWAQADDLVVLLVHEDRAAASAYLDSLQ